MPTEVLLVDDDPAMVAMGRLALQKAGYKVTVAYSVAEAHRAIGDGELGLAVVDLFLPDGDGLALCNHLRQVHDVPVLMISALDPASGDAMIDGDLGPQAFLSKPFGIDQLVGAVAELLAQGDG